MKFIRFALYLFYRHYDRGFTKSTAFFRTISSSVLLMFLNLMTIYLLLSAFDLIPALPTSGSGKYFALILLMVPPLIFLLLVVKEKDLQEMSISPKDAKRGSWLLIGYAIISFVLLIFSAFLFAHLHRPTLIRDINH